MFTQGRLIRRLPGYTANNQDDGVIYTKHVASPENKDAMHRARTSGAQFHISLYAPDEKQKNITQGLDIVIPILMEHAVYEFVVYYSGHVGREVTINSFKERREALSWQQLVEKLTEALAAKNIKPGLITSRETEIPGSNYVSYTTEGVSMLSNPYLNLFIDHPLKEIEQPPRYFVVALGRSASAPR